MTCNLCGYENVVGATNCEYCGNEFSLKKRATELDGSILAPAVEGPAFQVGTGTSPSRKRRTVYDPDNKGPILPQEPGHPSTAPAPGDKAVPPRQTHQQPRARADPGPVESSRVAYGDDPFAKPLPARSNFDSNDPFGRAVAHGEVVRSGPSLSRGRKSRTIVEMASPQSQRIEAVLVEYQRPGDPGRLHALASGRNTIGRDDDQDIIIEDPRVSGRHAFLFVHDQQATFIDVSTNGSLVDGQVVLGAQVNISSGSVLRLGAGCLLFLALPPIPDDAWNDR